MSLLTRVLPFFVTALTAIMTASCSPEPAPASPVGTNPAEVSTSAEDDYVDHTVLTRSADSPYGTEVRLLAEASAVLRAADVVGMSRDGSFVDVFARRVCEVHRRTYEEVFRRSPEPPETMTPELPVRCYGDMR